MTKHCSKCNKDFSDSIKFCSECGSKLEKSIELKNNKPTAKIVFGILYLIIGLIIFWNYSYSQDISGAEYYLGVLIRMVYISLSLLFVLIGLEKIIVR